MNRRLILATVAFLVIVYLLNFRLTTKSSKHWTVYGTNGCSWTRKQLKHMDDNNISYTYVNCDEQDCGSINAFPTLKDQSGKKVTGFTLVE